MSGGSKKVKETEAQKAAAKAAEDQWNIYKKELKPFEDTFIKRVGGINSDQSMSKVKKTTDLQYNKQYSGARQGTAKQQTANGVNPNDGKFKQSLSTLGVDQAIQQGDTVNRAQVGTQDKYIAGMQDIVATGMNQKSQSLAGMQNVADQSQKKAIGDAENAFNRSSANAQLVGSLAGAGTSAYMNRTPDAKNFKKNEIGAQPQKPYDPTAPQYA